MTLEFILLLSMFTLILMGTLVQGPAKSFKEAAPKLGARVENHLITGDGFARGTGSAAVGHQWKTKD